MTDRVSDKIALVFGAGSSGKGTASNGISNGQAIAIVLAREGASVIAVDINQDAAQETASIIDSEGGRSVAYCADVSNAADVASVVDQSISEFGRIDILVNNVGIGHLGDLPDVSEEDWDRVVDVNLKGPFLACRAVLPHMVKAGRGAIVNISTVGSIRVPRAPLASYNASKAGTNQLTRTIALRYAREGIRANAVLPGLIDTPLVRNQLLQHYGTLEGLIEARNDQTPTGKMGEPWDVGYATLFLASDEAKFVNGVLLSVDGGTAALMP